jgi:protein-S-isoprenylcysteine O-methyltransferase Ste14
VFLTWLLVMPLDAVRFGWRAVNEEQMLIQEFDGYEDYCQRVHYRFVPGLW